MVVNKVKLEEYAKKVYNGILPDIKKKIKEKNSFWSWLPPTCLSDDEISKKRISIAKSQEKTVIDKCKGKCVICGKKYKDADDFQFHHVNGDRTKTTTNNLVLVCLSCHKKIHTHANAKIQDYKNKVKKATR